MRQEDDLRALAKVMDFMRAISILFVLIHICWNPVYPDLIVGIYIIAHERRMDLAPDEKPSHG